MPSLVLGRFFLRLVPLVDVSLIIGALNAGDHEIKRVTACYVGQDNLSPRSTGPKGRGACAQEVHTETATDLHSQPADMPHRIIAAIGNGAAFRKGREFAAWLGLVPRQYSTGGKPRLLGISKRGNTYLRKILVHGARAAVLRIKRDQAPIGAWMDALERRAHRNVLIVAFANKLARIAWAVLSSGEPYRPCTSGAIPA